MAEFPFVGREEELKSLGDLFKKKSSSLVVIRGRRRIGKSRLVAEFAKPYTFLWFSGLPPTPKTTAQSQREEFAKQLATRLKAPPIVASDWSLLFSALARETRQGRVIILLDEISWMGSKDADFLGKLKNAWDLEFKQNAKLILILCGSISTWIEKNILRNTGFVGRLSLVMDLTELTLPACNTLLKTIDFRGSPYEKFKILSITGGIPRYLEEIKPDRLADENIKDLCFNKQGVLFREFQEVFTDIFAKRSKIYQRIVEILVEGDKEFLEIVTALNLMKSGRVSQYLQDLVLSGFVQRDYTWHIKDAKESVLSHYRLSDNYLRFYLKYIEKNKNKIATKHFNQIALSALPGYDSILGLQFENLVLNNRSFVWDKLHVYPETIVADNPYFQKAQLRKQGCQIDYLIQTKNHILYVCEVKFSRNTIGSEVIHAVKNKIERLALPKGYAVIPVLIHVGKVSEPVIDSQYFGHIVDFSELMN